MSNGDRWMPLYVSDYLGDTMHLTTLQHGALLLLLMHYWKAGPLPNDAEALASITRIDAKTWPAVWSKLAGFFTPNGDGTLHQKRMDSERERWADISSKRRDAGKRGAEAKHRTHPTNGGGPPTPLPQPNHEQPAVVPKHVIPQPSDAPRLSKTMANATSLPVDNLAIARDLPSSLPEICQPISGNCHDFAIPPVPSKKGTSSSFTEKKCAREANVGENGKDLPREPVELPEDGLKILLASLPPLPAPPKPFERKHTLDVQKAAVSKPVRPKACYVTGPQLTILRRRAGIPVVA